MPSQALAQPAVATHAQRTPLLPWFQSETADDIDRLTVSACAHPIHACRGKVSTIWLAQ